jgi:hypothetical protein
LERHKCAHARLGAANETKGPSAKPGPSIADCCRTEQRRIHTRHTRHLPENSAPVRPQKHTPRPIALKRHFRGYVIWQTQLDTAPGKRSRIKRRARQQATAGPNGRMEPAAITLRYLCALRRALRSVLRALPIFHHLNYLLASRLPHLNRNVTIAAANSGLARIFIGGCDSARWPA